MIYNFINTFKNLKEKYALLKNISYKIHERE